MWYSSKFKKYSMPFHATPAPDKLVNEGYVAGIPEYAPENHFIQLLDALPEKSQERIRKIAQDSDDPMASWEEKYWINIPEVMDAMYEEIDRELPNAQMIWGLEYPNKHQIEDYGPGLVHFDDSFMDQIGDTPDGLVYLYHPMEGENRIPPDIFTKVDPNNPKTWDAAMYGYDLEDDD